MEKLQNICRICLAKNVHMYVVVNETLHDLYEKLTDNPFVTEDCRPILACFICCAQLKKCYQLMKKCLDTEEQFAKMMMIKEEYEIKPLSNQDQFEYFHGFIRTSIHTISIVDVDQSESIVVKEKLPAVCERLEIDNDIIEPKIEHESDDDLVVKEKLPAVYQKLNDIIEPKEEHESDDDLKTVNKYEEYMDLNDTPLHHSESDPEDDIPLMKVKTEVEEQEVTKMEQETDRELVAKKRKVKTIKAEKMTTEQKEINTKNIEENQDRPRVQNKINNTTEVGYCRIQSKGEVGVVKDSKPFKCHICLRGFSSKGRRQRHIFTHDGETSNKCNVCGYEFSHKSTLKRHYRIHTGEKPYQCKICQYKTSTNYNLKQHNRVHTHDNPFKCDACLSSFLYNGHLIRHKEIYHPVHPVKTIKEPYKCNICPYECYSINDLVEHSRLHIGQNPYHKSVMIMTHPNQVHTGEISSNTVIAGNSQVVFTQLDSTQSVALLVPGTQLLDSIPKEALSEYSVKMCEN